MNTTEKRLGTILGTYTPPTFIGQSTIPNLRWTRGRSCIFCIHFKSQMVVGKVAFYCLFHKKANECHAGTVCNDFHLDPSYIPRPNDGSIVAISSRCRHCKCFAFCENKFHTDFRCSFRGGDLSWISDNKRHCEFFERDD